MTIQHLLNEGYFPKELPPCFYTYSFGKNYQNIINELNSNKKKELDKLLQSIQKNKTLSSVEKSEETVRIKQLFENELAYSDPTLFSIPKPGLSRNYVKIVNPIHQGKLSEVITNNFEDIINLYKESTFSVTKPSIEDEKGDTKRAIKHENYTFFKEQCIINSFKYSINLKSDISKYYPSIYTHSVPWVTFGGKDLYKKNRALSSKDPRKITNIYGDEIDNCLTWCQGQQTMGIPIGPDTSLIIAEIIGCYIDKLLFTFLKKKKIDFKGYRYYDDISLFFNTELDAQYALSELKNITNEFELKLNDSKTSITNTNNELEKEWALELKKFYFRPSKYHQREDLWNYFAIAFKYSNQYPDAAVLKLAVNKFFYVRIEKENWDYFQSLLFRLSLMDTSSLQKISKILITYKLVVNKLILKDYCYELIERHYSNGNDYELSWSLWLLKEFNIQPNKDIYLKILKSKSVCAIIIALDLLKNNKRIKNIDFFNIDDKIKTENLNTKYWLLVYETIFNKWDKKNIY